MKIDPASRCPCGSKKPYRECCKKVRDRNRIITFIVVFALSIIFAKVMFQDNQPSAPPGKVWSPEHGHYHDANPPAGTASPLGTPPGQPNAGAAQTGQNVPQPAGPVPTGKVWSPEHGHYHDVNTPSGTASPLGAAPGQPNAGTAQPTQSIPQPAGPVPPGKVWSPEHGHWHDVQ